MFSNKIIAILRLVLVVYLPINIIFFTDFILNISFDSPFLVGQAIGTILGFSLFVLMLIYHGMQGYKELKNEIFKVNALRKIAIGMSLIFIIANTTKMVRIFRHGLTFTLFIYLLITSVFAIFIWTDISIIREQKKSINPNHDLD